MSEFDEFTVDLESRGEDSVRATLSRGGWANRRKEWAVGWLRAKETSRVTESDALSLSLSAEGNAAVRDANRIAEASLKEARSAKIAAWFAAIAAIVAAICALLAFFQSKSS